MSVTSSLAALNAGERPVPAASRSVDNCEAIVHDLGGTVIGPSYVWETRKRGRSSNESLGCM